MTDLPDPELVEQSEFLRQVFVKLSEDNAIDLGNVNGAADSTELTQVQGDLDTVEADVATNTASISSISSLLGGFRLTDLADFSVETGGTTRPWIKILIGEYLGILHIELGGWDMNADANGPATNLTSLIGTGIQNNILGFETCVINDAKSRWQSMRDESGATNNNLYVIQSGSDFSVQPARTSTGIFDNTSYDDATFNRGYTLVFFKPL